MRAYFEKVPLADRGFFHLKIRADPEFEFRWHYHPEFELTLITKSHGRRFVGDNIADYEDGDLVLIGPNMPHTWCSRPMPKHARHHAVVVQFSPDLLGPRRMEGSWLGPVHHLFERSLRGIEFRGAVRAEVTPRLMALENLPPLRALAELLTVLEVLARSDDSVVLSHRTFLPQSGAPSSHPIDKACKFINEHYRDPIRLEEVAHVLAMSPSAFSRFFHRTTGKTFVSYVNELRIGHACQMLAETERGIADIASTSGFTNRSHFNRYFLRAKKMRPREFRDEHRRYRAPRS